MKAPPRLKLTAKNVRRFAQNFHFREKEKENENTVKAKENLYLNEDKTKVVDEASDEQAYLLAGKGCEIPAWAVNKFNLTPGAVSGEGRKTKAASAEEDGEKASGPKSNKAENAKENK